MSAGRLVVSSAAQMVRVLRVALGPNTRRNLPVTPGPAGPGGSRFRRLMRWHRLTDPAQMAHVPCIRGLRFPVASVVAMVEDGMTEDEVPHGAS